MRKENEMKTREEIVARLQAEYETIQHMENLYEKVEGMSDKSRAAAIFWKNWRFRFRNIGRKRNERIFQR